MCICKKMAAFKWSADLKQDCGESGASWVPPLIIVNERSGNFCGEKRYEAYPINFEIVSELFGECYVF